VDLGGFNRAGFQFALPWLSVFSVLTHTQLKLVILGQVDSRVRKRAADFSYDGGFREGCFWMMEIGFDAGVYAERALDAMHRDILDRPSLRAPCRPPERHILILR